MNWFLVQTKPNGHFIASQHLKRQKFEVFLPLVTKTLRRRNKFSNKTVPLFPSYLFIGSSLDQIPWLRVNSSRGVSKAVTLDGKYRAVDEEIIIGLKCRCDANGLLKSANNISEGNIVKIKRGPLSDFMCQVEAIEKSKRVWVLLDLMKQKIRAEVSLSDL